MQRDFSKIDSQHFDVLVCGAGIYGAWTAYDAALRGLKVALVDQADFASATSSASSKLIHGGLRYLESLDFKLVKKSLAERQSLLHTAPHRVWPLRFGVPVYKHSRLNSLQLSIGLKLYDFLAGKLPKDLHFRRYHANEFNKRFPCLDGKYLKSGFTYLDAQTDDARFVLELIAGAQALDAVCVNYCQVTEFLENKGIVNGVVLLDKVTGATGKVYAKKLVNTMGRWSLEQHYHKGRLSKGVHLILPKILDNEALLLTAPSDGRVFFIIPWYGLTLLGTTDSNYHGDINHLTVEPEEIDYLLNAANHVLHCQWTTSDIIGSYAGLRVLKPDDADSPSAVSRDWQIIQTPNGLLCSVGGKITSAREDAQSLVDLICKQLGLELPGQTFGKAFPWMPTEVSSKTTDTPYQIWAKTRLAEALKLGIDELSANWLLRRHGVNTSAVLQLCAENPDLIKRIIPSLPFIRADLLFCAQHECVVHLEDLLRRRLPLLILANLSFEELHEIGVFVAETLGWDDARLKQEVQDCVQASILLT